MTAKLTISFSDEILRALRANKAITIRLDSAGVRGPRNAANSQPRAGSLPARAIVWARSRGRSFGTRDVERKLKVSRAHASMLLCRLANGRFPITRVRRGEYEYRA